MSHTPCSCQIHYSGKAGGFGDSISYCPLHAAAPKLLEALVAATEHCDKSHKPPIPLALMTQVRQAIAHAEQKG